MFDDLYAARKGKFGRFAGKVSRKADAITRWGDRWAVVTGAYGCYKAWLAHNLARGMAPEAAEKEAWLRTSAAFNETQQSNMVEYQSVFSQYGGAWSMVLLKLHLARESVDVDGERLVNDEVCTGIFEFFMDVFSSHVGTIFGITTTLVLLGTQLLDNLFVVRQILGIQLHVGEGQ